MENKTIVDENGFIIDYGVTFINGIAKDFEMKEEYKIAPFYKGEKKFKKPRWDGTEWTEGATDKEIQAWQEENKTPEKEPNEQEILNAQLLEEIAQQKIVNAQLMQEIAELKGGTANV